MLLIYAIMYNTIQNHRAKKNSEPFWRFKGSKSPKAWYEIPNIENLKVEEKDGKKMKKLN